MSTTFHAFPTQAEQITPHRLYPRDVRNPQTAEEATAALVLIDSQIRACEARRSFYDKNDGDTERSDSLISRWKERRAEIVYIDEMFRAGHVIDAATQARNADASQVIASLRSNVERLTARAAFYENQSRDYGRMSKGVNPAHVLRVEEMNADLVAKNKRLVAQIEEMKCSKANSADAAVDDAPRRLKKSMHDTYAFALEALEEVAATGAVMPPLARLLMEQAADSMPAGHRTAWRAKDLVFKRDAAEAKYGAAT
jgi:hypothetical protein